MKKRLLIVLGFVFILSLSSFGSEDENNFRQEEKLKKDISLDKKLSNPQIALVVLDGSVLTAKTKGDLFGCDDKIIFKNIEGEYNLRQLLEKMFSFSEYNETEDLYNVFQNSDLEVENLGIESKILKVELFGELIMGGMCDNPRVSVQIDRTVRLFYPDFMGEIQILINGEDLRDFLSEKD